ncbi:cytochrome P450 302a1, mitochondrial-like [Argiope bruennichi]|uniref:cytochrome P450 302a1, mitochondrial-like n=1 Tax=Argiope bruennichi TaxID=94029 RepID=UPI002494890C|nr:cytochrome P450 302a1, mitochondrial-like [Argiope bruennichi]
MAFIFKRQLSQKLYAATLRAFCSQTTGKPYWLSKFPDGQVRSFEEIPIIEERYDARKIHEVSKGWFQKYGHVVRECMTDGTSCVHLYHFEDFRAVYYNDGTFPRRKSHQAIKQYRSERTDMYENVGLGAGDGAEWWMLRNLMAVGITEKIIRSLHPSLEEVADDLVKMLHIAASEGDVNMLPWLFRWAFESIGVVTLNRRLNALSEYLDEEADKMVEAADLTNEMIALTEVDWANYEKHYQRLVSAQDYMYFVILRYVHEISAKGDSNCVVKTLLEQPNGSVKNAITLTMDIFQGALQTVPLTVLMALYNLARNKQVQDAAREELTKLLPLRDSKYFSIVKNFKYDIPPYLNGIVWETLRINPPIIGNRRVLQEDLILGGYIVPKGIHVILHQQVACLLEENFADPLKFNPERHPSPHMQHLEYVFGARRRICFGKTFALDQMALVIAKILRDFEIVYDGEEVNMINRLHNKPEVPLYLRLFPLM